MIPIVLGIGLMLFFYFMPKSKGIGNQIYFGFGIYMVLVGVGIIATMLRQQISAFTFPEVSEIYTATVVDIPQEKDQSYLYRVKLDDSGKFIVCYFSKTDNGVKDLNVGDTFVFFSQIQTFKNKGGSANFNYARYMYNEGYSGIAFIKTDTWNKERPVTNNLFIKSVQIKQYLLGVYKSLNLTFEEYGMLAALTLGYTDALSDEILESFRVIGVSHILAVSGMHIVIIFILISSLLSFIPRYSKYNRVKQIIIIILLWTYVFIIGLPPSAIRACFMITVFCIATFLRVKNYSYNTLFLTAFMMLLWNPLWLFNMGFQLSFLAVFSILSLMPELSNFMPVKNKIMRYFRDVFIMSLSVQIGIFPLCLHYFGTFPVYFFIANLIIIPLTTLALYGGIAILFIEAISVLIPVAFYPNSLLINLFKLLIKITTSISSFLEHLPWASLEGIKLSLIGLVLFWLIIVSSIYYFREKQPKALIITLICILFLIGESIWTMVDNRNTLTVFYKPASTQIICQVGYDKEEITEIENNRIIRLANGLKYLIVSNDTWKGQFSAQRMKVDYLHLVENNSVSLFSLNRVFEIDKVILDSSLSSRTVQRFVLECEKLRIPYYDVSDNGDLRIFF